jgi:hypothetical protein
LGSLGAAINRASEEPRDPGPGTSRIKSLIDLLRPNFDLRVSLDAAPLASRIVDDGRDLSVEFSDPVTIPAGCRLTAELGD